MTNWADDVIEEEADEGEEYRSDGDVLGEVTGKARRRIPSNPSIPYEEQWETDMDAFQALKVCACIEPQRDFIHAMLLRRIHQQHNSDKRSKCILTGSTIYFSVITTKHVSQTLLLCATPTLISKLRAVVSASSDGTIKAWSPHSHTHNSPLHEPTVVGSHTDYVRCLAYW